MPPRPWRRAGARGGTTRSGQATRCAVTADRDERGRRRLLPPLARWQPITAAATGGARPPPCAADQCRHHAYGARMLTGADAGGQWQQHRARLCLRHPLRYRQEHARHALDARPLARLAAIGRPGGQRRPGRSDRDRRARRPNAALLLLAGSGGLQEPAAHRHLRIWGHPRHVHPVDVRWRQSG